MLRSRGSSCRLHHARQVVCAAAATSAEPEVSVFEELSAGTARKYIMVSGKGGVGKTSLAASLAVRFAQAGHTTLVVSTDPAHSLGDSLDQVGHLHLVCCVGFVGTLLRSLAP